MPRLIFSCQATWNKGLLNLLLVEHSQKLIHHMNGMSVDKEELVVLLYGKVNVHEVSVKLLRPTSFPRGFDDNIPGDIEVV
jgi:hypothetical protein